MSGETPAPGPTPGDAHRDAVNKKAGRNIYAAIPAALVLIAVAVVGLVWANWLFVAFLLVLLVGGMWELHRGLRDHAQVRTAVVPALVGGVGSLAATFAYSCAAGYTSWWSPARHLRDLAADPTCQGDVCWAGDGVAARLAAHPAEVLVAGLALTTAACLAWRLRRGVTGYLKDAAATLFLLAYVALLGGSLLLLLLATDGPAKIGFFILVIVGSDTGGYVAGVFFGRHQMAPTISAAKSWEGALGSLILAPVAGLVVVAVAFPVPWWQAVIAAEIIAVAGMLGDLAESAVKRDLGIKDLGSVIPGHGGVMDRVDSYLLAAPVAWATLSVLTALAAHA